MKTKRKILIILSAGLFLLALNYYMENRSEENRKVIKGNQNSENVQLEQKHKKKVDY